MPARTVRIVDGRMICPRTAKDLGALRRRRCCNTYAGNTLHADDCNAVVFTNCNVCGIKLRPTDPDEMGMCERCAAE